MKPEHTPVFQDREVRQALLTALDKQGIVDTVYAGYGEVAIGTHSTLSVAYAPDQMRTRYDFDPERAQAMLETAGWVDGRRRRPRQRRQSRSPSRVLLPESSTGDLLAAIFQESWNAIGAEVEIEIVPFPTCSSTAWTPSTSTSACSAFRGHQSRAKASMFRCDATPPGGFNYLVVLQPSLR